MDHKIFYIIIFLKGEAPPYNENTQTLNANIILGKEANMSRNFFNQSSVLHTS